MKKSALARKREKEIRAVHKELLADLRGARSHVARIVRPFHRDLKRFQNAIAKWDRVVDDAALPDPEHTRKLLDCLLECLREAEEDLGYTIEALNHWAQISAYRESQGKK